MLRAISLVVKRRTPNPLTGVRFSHRPHMEERIQKLEKEIAIIKERNARVESDKAWEVSYFRVVLITIIIYLIELRYYIGSDSYFLNAFVPAIGFLISAQSFPFIKKWWMKNHNKKRPQSFNE